MDDHAEALADEQGVRDACMRYWAGFDRNDIELYLAAFTADATLSLFGGAQVVSIADMAARGELASPFDHTSHAPASQTISIDGDRATADTYVVAHLVPAGGPISVRGVRYLDDLVRDGDRWRIKCRQHFVLWQYDIARVDPHLPGMGAAGQSP
jgi:SnoaL-like domain